MNEWRVNVGLRFNVHKWRWGRRVEFRNKCQQSEEAKKIISFTAKWLNRKLRQCVDCRGLALRRARAVESPVDTEEPKSSSRCTTLTSFRSHVCCGWFGFGLSWPVSTRILQFLRIHIRGTIQGVEHETRCFRNVTVVFVCQFDMNRNKYQLCRRHDWGDRLGVMKILLSLFLVHFGCHGSEIYFRPEIAAFPSGNFELLICDSFSQCLYHGTRNCC